MSCEVGPTGLSRLTTPSIDPSQLSLALGQHLVASGGHTFIAYESHATDASPEAKLIGGAVMQNKDKAARVNSITYVSKDDPPFLITRAATPKK